MRKRWTVLFPLLGVGLGVLGALAFRRYVRDVARRAAQGDEPLGVIGAGQVPRLRAAVRWAIPQEPLAPAETKLPEFATSTLAEQREAILMALRIGHGASDAVIDELRGILSRSHVLGLGNPRVTRHPMSVAECQQARSKWPTMPGDSELCDDRYMVALFDPATQKEIDATACIDQYEFPNVPCSYPLVWVRASEAEQICRALDKRLCDAHEWEAACAGALRPVEEEYDWSKPRLQDSYWHNKDRELIWAYGPARRQDLCATGGSKSPGCVDVTWQRCGSNTFPTGAFPQCVSPLGVYDLHGNVAEHMSHPLSRGELASEGGSGQTEMKGSWFAFDRHSPHPDDCRWRAKDWHPTAIGDPVSHHNYHLGFRCCRTIAPRSHRVPPT